MIIPSFSNDSTKFIIASQFIDNNFKEEYNISAGKNALIFINNTIDDLYIKGITKYYFDSRANSFYNNTLITFSSEIKNMKFANSSEFYDFMVQNSYPIPIYVDKSNKDFKIKIKKYIQRYAFFGVINNDLLKIYISSISGEKSGSILFDNKQPFPLNIRINSDYKMLYEYFNFYFYKSEMNINIYIKKLYGETDIYECNADSINKNDLSILTKPINNCKNKKSILNRIYNLEGTKLITGYLGHNALLDIYIDINDNNNSIKLSSLMNNPFNNGAKYLKKDKEYSLDFNADHLVKLEPGFNAEIYIYDNNGYNRKINSQNPTTKIQGNNLKIKSNKMLWCIFMENF